MLFCLRDIVWCLRVVGFVSFALFRRWDLFCFDFSCGLGIGLFGVCLVAFECFVYVWCVMVLWVCCFFGFELDWLIWDLNYLVKDALWCFVWFRFWFTIAWILVVYVWVCFTVFVGICLIS